MLGRFPAKMAAFMNQTPIISALLSRPSRVPSSSSSISRVPKCTISDRPPAVPLTPPRSPRSIQQVPNNNNNNEQGGEEKSSSNSNSGFRVISDTVSWKRYQTVHERVVRYPDGREVSFDVVGTAARTSVFVFPYDTRTRTVTLLREYSPGINGLTYGFVAGMHEPAKHPTLEDAAFDELSEEAHLKSGQLIRLTPVNSISADKYSVNSFNFFLNLDPIPDIKPKNRDAEEFIEIFPGISIPQVLNMVHSGMFNTPSSLLAMLAIEELRKRNLV